MRPRIHSTSVPVSSASRAGSVLLVVLWIVFGVVSVTLYFAHSMTMEMRGSDNRVAGVEAEQAIEGARRYLSCVLSNVNTGGVLPDPMTYQCAAVPVGNAHYWLIGRGDDTEQPRQLHFGLIDEASKLNLNTVNSNALMNLPGMTSDLAANIIAWRSTNTTSQTGAAESAAYAGLPQPYLAKNAPFETVEELRLVYNMDYDLLYGEDANLNGILDPNENDGDAMPPADNLDGVLNPGLLEYFTVYTREPATLTNGTARYNITTFSQATSVALRSLMQTNGISATRAQQITQAAGNGTFASLLQFYYATGMTTTEFTNIETSVRGASLVGLVNINTASEAVLSCIPGMTNGQAAQVISYREANTNTLSTQLPSMIWITQVLSRQDALSAAPYITGHGYQFMADVAALGHNGRGYRRTRFVFDTRQGVPVILHRQEMSQLGWALGPDIRAKWLLAKDSP